MLDEKFVGETCCNRRTERAVVRAIVERWNSAMPTSVVFQDNCHRCRVSIVKFVPVRGTHWASKIGAAIERGDLNREDGTLDSMSEWLSPPKSPSL